MSFESSNQDGGESNLSKVNISSDSKSKGSNSSKADFESSVDE